MLLKEDLQALDERSKAEEERLSERMHSLINENDVLKAALKQEQKAREAAEAEYLRLEEEHIVLLEELSGERRRNSIGPKLGDTNHWGNAHVQPAVCRVANLDKEVANAMNAIDSLREELDTKETQLVQAKMDKETEWEDCEAALAQEYKEMLNMREKQWQQLWMLKEQELLSANDKILHQLADQRGEFAIVQGALRELEWSINHGDIDIKAKLADISKKEGMVKVHTSHLEEVDRYILDLQTKLEESEKKRKSAEVAASIRELKRVASFDLAAVQRNRDGRPAPNMVRHDGHLISHLSLENGMNGLRIHTRSSLGDNSGLSSFSSIREIQRDTYWEVENSSGYVLLSAYTVFYLLGFCGILSTKQELYLQGALITE
jgi:KaiC/GvpD/RAD55 family RecA-like ATPase